MTDRPVIMSSPMVKALLREIEQPGTGKTQTRRLAWQLPVLLTEEGAAECGQDGWKVSGPDDTDTCVGWPPSAWQKIKPGDNLWIREEHWRLGRWIQDGKTKTGRDKWRFSPANPDITVFYEPMEAYRGTYRGQFSSRYWKRRSFFMPRAVSRLTLVVTATKIEPVQAISHEDAVAEGMGIFPHSMSAQKRFSELWDTLHAKPGTTWAENPDVVAVSFQPHLCNIDAMPFTQWCGFPDCGEGVDPNWTHCLVCGNDLHEVGVITERRRLR